jgi:BASS family bile acid:Na+ symporter
LVDILWIGGPLAGEKLDRVAGDLYNGALVVALWMTGLGLGLSSDVAGFLTPLRNTKLVAKLIVLDVVAIPLLVWAQTHLFDVPRDSAIGLLLVGISSAGPLGITASRIAGGDARAAVSFVVVLEAANAVAIPAWVALLLPPGVRVPFGQLLAALVILVLAPLAVGVGLRSWRGRRVQGWPSPLATLSNLLVLLVVILVLIRYWGDLVEAVTNGVAAVAAITTIAALALGWTVARSSGLRVVVALVTGIRASALALAIAIASFRARPAVQAAVVTFGVFSVVVPVATAFLVAGWHKRRGSGTATRRPGPPTVGG